LIYRVTSLVDCFIYSIGFIGSIGSIEPM